jgi:hypothetical protein
MEVHLASAQAFDLPQTLVGLEPAFGYTEVACIGFRNWRRFSGSDECLHQGRFHMLAVTLEAVGSCEDRHR